MTPAQTKTLLAMDALEARGVPLTNRAIAELQGLARTTIHERIGLLEGEGMVVRLGVNRPGCRRLSPRGKRLARKIRTAETPRELLQRAWDGASRKDRRRFLKGLGK